MSLENNPYKPPQAELGDGSTAKTLQRPRAVEFAVVLIGINILIAVIRIVSSWNGMLAGETSGLSMLMQILGVALWVWICFALFSGRNWARILQLILTLISLLGVVALFATGQVAASAFHYLSTGELVMSLLPLFLSIAAVYLVYVPGRSWFAKRAG